MHIKYFFRNLVLPVSQDEDRARSEFILIVLLTAIIGLSFVALVINLFRLFFGFADSVQGVINLSVLSFIAFSFFILLYFLSRKGFIHLAAFIFLGTFFLLNSHTVITHGVDIPEAVLVYALIIFMAGILISSRFAFFVALITTFFVLTVGYFQIYSSVMPIGSYWKMETTNMANVILIGVILSLMSVISWLSNREIEKSLARARRSETELKKERDSLEVTVEARTRELKETQAEKMTQLYRFAEFGRLSSGLFHDLINPLTAVSLNMEKVKNTQQGAYSHVEFAIQNTDIAPISETAAYLDKAIFAAKKMEDMVVAVRKQLSRQEIKTNFSLKEEIESAIEVLSHKARKAGVAMQLFSREDLNPVRSSRGALDHTFAETNRHSSSRQVAEHSASNGVKTYGDAVKFNQVALNLIANAIDSYLPAVALPRPSEALREGGAKEGLEKRDGETRTVTMSLSQEGGVIIFEVKDNGIGILEENKPRLFEPFFTTKKEGYGLGIGLSIIKRIVEKDFGGSISVESREGKGSTFTAKFPQKNSNE